MKPSIAFTRYIRPYTDDPGITPRRLAAARRALQRQRDKQPLFAEEIAAQQPTPEARLIAFHEDLMIFWRNMRNFHAQCWRKARAALRQWPEATQAAAITKWNARWGGSKDAAYFADFIRTYAKSNNLHLPPDY